MFRLELLREPLYLPLCLLPYLVYQVVGTIKNVNCTTSDMAPRIISVLIISPSRASNTSVGIVRSYISSCTGRTYKFTNLNHAPNARHNPATPRPSLALRLRVSSISLSSVFKASRTFYDSTKFPISHNR